MDPYDVYNSVLFWGTSVLGLLMAGIAAYYQ